MPVVRRTAPAPAPLGAPLTGARRRQAARALGVVALTAAACRPRGDVHRDSTEVERAATAIAAEAAIPLAVTADGRRILLQERTTSGFKLRVWDRALGRVTAEQATAGRPRLTAFSPDGRMVAFFVDTGRTRYGLRVWDVAEGKVVQPAMPETRIVTQTVWAPAGGRLSAVQELLDDTRDLYWTSPADGAPAHPALNDIGDKAGIAWSPDGTHLASVARLDSTAVTIVGTTGGTRRLPVVAKGVVRDLAWSPAGTKILASVRPAGQKFFGLTEITLASGAVKRLATDSAGDAVAPLYLPGEKGFLYRSLVGAMKRTIACDVNATHCHVVGPRDGQIVPWAVHPSGDSVYLSQLLPRAILAADVRTGEHAVAFSADVRVDAGQTGRVDVASYDRLKIPLYLRRAARVEGRAPAIFIQVMGALGKESPPPWDSKTDYLLASGIDVMKVNYRGKAGFGPELLNAPGGDSGRVADVLAAWRYAVDSLGIAPERTILFGHSDGAVLAAAAALREPRVGQLMVSSILRNDPWTTHSAARCVIAFHGELDPLPPAQARTVLEGMLGRGATAEPCGHFQVLSREAHEIERADSWAEVYADAVTLVRRGR